MTLGCLLAMLGFGMYSHTKVCACRSGGRSRVDQLSGQHGVAWALCLSRGQGRHAVLCEAAQTFRRSSCRRLSSSGPPPLKVQNLSTLRLCRCSRTLSQHPSRMYTRTAPCHLFSLSSGQPWPFSPSLARPAQRTRTRRCLRRQGLGGRNPNPKPGGEGGGGGCAASLRAAGPWGSSGGLCGRVN